MLLCIVSVSYIVSDYRVCVSCDRRTSILVDCCTVQYLSNFVRCLTRGREESVEECSIKTKEQNELYSKLYISFLELEASCCDLGSHNYHIISYPIEACGVGWGGGEGGGALHLLYSLC